MASSNTNVDTSLHPHLSGRAATFASAHSSPAPLILYGGWFCPFVQRTWIVMHEKKIPHQYIEINPYKKDPEFLALNPRGLVPTLAVPVGSNKDGDNTDNNSTITRKPLYESTILCSYLDEVYTSPTQHGPALLPASSSPTSAYQRAHARIWIDHINTKIIPGFYRFLQHTPTKPYSLDEARTEFLGHIATLMREAAPSSSGPYFLGESFSMVDIMLAPWAARAALLDKFKEGGLGIPEEGHGGDDEHVWTRWRKWKDAVLNRQSVLDTLSDWDRYVEAYTRYAEDTTQSEVAKATRSGRGLP